MVNLHPDDRHYLAFHIHRIGQIQSTRMSQEVRTLSFIFNEPMNIVFGLIPISQSELLLLHRKTTKDSAPFLFYMNDIFGAFQTDQKKYIFLHDIYFPHMVWSRLKIM